MRGRSLITYYLVAAMSFAFTASAQNKGVTSYQITDVKIDGNIRIDSKALIKQLPKRSGSFSPLDISKAVKIIFKTGFFEDVSAALEQEARGSGKVLVLKVVEKPTVRKVFISGNEDVSDSDLREVLTFGTRRFLDKSRLEALMQHTKSLYESRGYYEAHVDYQIVPVSTEQVDLTFKIEEGPRYKIRRIEVAGLENADRAVVLDAIQTKRYKWWSSWLFGTGRLNREILESDAAAMKQVLFDFGLLDASVSEPVIEKRADGLYISFVVDEGPQYKVDELRASGDLVDDSERETLEGIKTEVGSVFSASKIRSDTFHIGDKFTDIGYAFANVVPNTRLNRSAKTVQLDFSINKGNVVTVDEIKIRGNEKTYDNVIRREIKVEEQETYSSSKVRRSQELLQRLGYFDEVSVSTEPVEGKDAVNLNVNVREASTGSFSAGAGYSSSDGAIFNARISERNLLGTGRSIDFNADIGTERENYVISLNDRRLNDSYFSGGLDILKTERDFTDFNRRRDGASVSVGYPLEEVFGEIANDISASLKYQYLIYEISNVNIEDAAQLVIDSQGETRVSGVTPRLIRNTIDNPINPRRGSLQDLGVDIMAFGGDTHYYQVDARNQIYYPFLESEWGDLIFSWRTRFGYGNILGGGEDEFPVFERYFPGGINSVRGFKNRTLGPKDERGNEYGGSKQFVNNFELIFPLVEAAGLKGVVFYDAGQAFDDDETINISDLRQAYGYGIRWTSPLGPIRIEFGFPLDKEEGEDSMVTLFSFGAPL